MNIFIAFLDCMDFLLLLFFFLWIWLEMNGFFFLMDLVRNVNVKNINKKIKLMMIIFVTIFDYKQKLVTK